MLHFKDGYLRRMREEGLESGLPGILGKFEAWLGDHFNVPIQSQSAFHLVDSYAAGSSDAFDKFYELFGRFSADYAATDDRLPDDSPTEQTQRHVVPREPKNDLCGILRLIRKNPAMWIGYPHFSGVHGFLIGYEGAGRDIGLLTTPGEQIFDDFKLWIEKTRFPRGKPRPWFKLITFHSSNDSGFTRHGAYVVFFDLLDEFARELGQPSFFEACP